MDRIEQDADRHIYMTADEAKANGLVDELLSRPEGRQVGVAEPIGLELPLRWPRWAHSDR